MTAAEEFRAYLREHTAELDRQIREMNLRGLQSPDPMVRAMCGEVLLAMNDEIGVNMHAPDLCTEGDCVCGLDA